MCQLAGIRDSWMTTLCSINVYIRRLKVIRLRLQVLSTYQHEFILQSASLYRSISKFYRLLGVDLGNCEKNASNSFHLLSMKGLITNEGPYI